MQKRFIELTLLFIFLDQNSLRLRLNKLIQEVVFHCHIASENAGTDQHYFDYCNLHYPVISSTQYTDSENYILYSNITRTQYTDSENYILYSNISRTQYTDSENYILYRNITRIQYSDQPKRMIFKVLYYTAIQYQ